MAVKLTGVERTFLRDEIIVSKTDLRGRITYANRVFVNVSGYTVAELIGQPHSIIRHPQMPRAVFKLLWDTIEQGDEIFAYVINRSKNGDHYWVFAHVTPNLDQHGTITGYHSSRRVVRPEVLPKVIPLYDRLLREEQNHADTKAGLKASVDLMQAMLRQQGFEAYDRFVLSL